MKIKHLLAILTAFSTSFAFANEPAKQPVDSAAINAACSADGKAAGCGDKQVGTGLLRCLGEYRKAHKEFALSAGCKEQLEKHHKPDPAIQADNAAINTACAADAQTAGCGDKKVGSGLLRCLGEYRKAHKEFTLSAGCKSAVEKRRDDQKQHGEQKGK
jgi:hypothetical protein